ncbi:MAG: dTDP-4-dehydrorhamnose 3,5-epimerase [Crocinitomicaceae bacterium]|nr:dTDP-4-dehydrorhamnose 3,5-epimerase [Crocinitomicaceae bacterium]
MEIKRYTIEGLFSFVPAVFSDERGAFMETFNQKLIEEAAGRKIEFVQDNQSISKINVVRGLHFQVPPFAQAKLVRVLKGKVIDVAVDLRKNSPTFGQHVSVELSAENNTVFFIPAGFAHGFSVLEDNTVFAYKCSAFYSKHHEGSILWNDPLLKLDWQVQNPLVSEKDKTGPLLNELNSPF